MPDVNPASSAYAAVRHLARRRIDDEVVVLDLRRSRIYGLNPSAGEVLEALQQPLTLQQLASRFTIAAEVAPELPAELGKFVEELTALGMIDRRPPPAAGDTSPEAAATKIPWVPPAVLWQEEAARVTSQISPPQQIGNPACLP